MINLTPLEFKDRLFIGVNVKSEHVSLPHRDTPLLNQAQKIFPVAFSSLIVGEQIHQTRIECVGTVPASPPTILPGTDGLITAVPGTALGIFTADCTAVMVYDPTTLCLGMAHAGWRGTYENILEKLVTTMITAHGVQPTDCHAVLGPAIGGSCYEISEALAEMFRIRFPFSKPFLSSAPSGKPRLDLRGLQRAQLINARIPDDHITMSSDCTHCRADLYYSYRRDGTLTGRHLTLAVLL